MKGRWGVHKCTGVPLTRSIAERIYKEIYYIYSECLAFCDVCPNHCINQVRKLSHMCAENSMHVQVRRCTCRARARRWIDVIVGIRRQRADAIGWCAGSMPTRCAGRGRCSVSEVSLRKAGLIHGGRGRVARCPPSASQHKLARDVSMLAEEVPALHVGGGDGETNGYVRTMHDVSVPSGGLVSEPPHNHYSSQVLHLEPHTELQSVPDPIGPGRQVHEAVAPQLVQGRSGRETNPARRFSCTAKHAHTSTSARKRSQEAVCVCDGEVEVEGKDCARSEQTCSM
jgi:hypothetical protein